MLKLLFLLFISVNISFADSCQETLTSIENEYSYLPHFLIEASYDSFEQHIINKSKLDIKAEYTQISRECEDAKLELQRVYFALDFIQKVKQTINNQEIQESLKIAFFKIPKKFENFDEIEKYIDQRFKGIYSIHSNLDFRIKSDFYTSEVNLDQEELEIIRSNQAQSWKLQNLYKTKQHVRYNLIHSFFRDYSLESFGNLMKFKLDLERLNSQKSNLFKDDGSLSEINENFISESMCKTLRKREFYFIDEMIISECYSQTQKTLKYYPALPKLNITNTQKLTKELNFIINSLRSYQQSINRRKLKTKVSNIKVRNLDELISSVKYEVAPDVSDPETLMTVTEYKEKIQSISPLLMAILKSSKMGLDTSFLDQHKIKKSTLIYHKTETKSDVEERLRNTSFKFTEFTETKVSTENVQNALEDIIGNIDLLIESHLQSFAKVYQRGSSIISNPLMPLMHIEIALYEIFKLFHTDRGSLFHVLQENPRYLEHLDLIISQAKNVKNSYQKMNKYLKNMGTAFSIISLVSGGGYILAGGKLTFKIFSHMAYRSFQRSLSKRALRLGLISTFSAIPASVFMAMSLPGDFQKLRFQKVLVNRARIFQSFGYFEKQAFQEMQNELYEINKRFKWDIALTFLDVFLITEIRDASRAIKRLNQLSGIHQDSLRAMKALSQKSQQTIKNVVINKALKAKLTAQGVNAHKWFVSEKILDLLHFKNRLNLSEREFNKILNLIESSPEQLLSGKFQNAIKQSTRLIDFTQTQKRVVSTILEAKKLKDQKVSQLSRLLEKGFSQTRFSYISRVRMTKIKSIIEKFQHSPSEDLFHDLSIYILEGKTTLKIENFIDFIDDSSNVSKLKKFLNSFNEHISMTKPGRSPQCPSKLPQFLMTL